MEPDNDIVNLLAHGITPAQLEWSFKFGEYGLTQLIKQHYKTPARLVLPYIEKAIDRWLINDAKEETFFKNIQRRATVKGDFMLINPYCHHYVVPKTNVLPGEPYARTLFFAQKTGLIRFEEIPEMRKKNIKMFGYASMLRYCRDKQIKDHELLDAAENQTFIELAYKHKIFPWIPETAYYILKNVR